MGVVGRLDQYASMLASEFDETTANGPSITGFGTYYASEFSENVGIATTITANVFAPYDPVYDEFGGTLFGAGQGRYMRQNTDKSVIVYNEIDEVTDLFGRGIVRDGLVLDLDAGKTASYVGSGTTWTDLSASGNNGTLQGSPTYSSANGGSFILNGIDQYATIVGYKGITGTAARTSIIWFKTNVLNTAYRLLGWGTASIGSKWNISLDSTTYRARVELAGGAAVTCNSGTQNVADTNWHMVAATVPANGTANDIKIYIDGNLITDVTILSGATAINTASNADVSFGASIVDAVPGYLNGNIAVAQIYNRALTAAEVSQNYNALKHRFGL
jgi:hypothetical protein